MTRCNNFPNLLSLEILHGKLLAPRRPCVCLAPLPVACELWALLRVRAVSVRVTQPEREERDASVEHQGSMSVSAN